eukprot:2369715-Pyramimonas_sp.AAC.1
MCIRDSFGAHSRVASFRSQGSPRTSPALIAFDFEQAFPSISQGWLQMAIGALRLPQPVKAALKVLRHCSPRYYGGSPLSFLCCMTSG